MKKTNKMLLIGVLLSLIPFIVLFYKFNKLSGVFADWGSFGSYMSGTLGIIVSVLNLIVFIILTIEVTKITDKNNEKNLKYEEKKILADLRYDSIKNFETNVFPLLNIIGDKVTEEDINEKNKNYIMWETLKVIAFIDNFSKTNIDIFPNIKNKSLNKTLNDFYDHMQNNRKGYGAFIRNYMKYSQEFVVELRKTMLNEIKY